MSDDAANNRLALKRIRADVHRILVRWDPLALKGLRGGEMEYEKYSAPLSIMAKKGEDHMAIARHVANLMKQWGMPDNNTKAVDIARKIYNAGAVWRGDDLV